MAVFGLSLVSGLAGWRAGWLSWLAGWAPKWTVWLAGWAPKWTVWLAGRPGWLVGWLAVFGMSLMMGLLQKEWFYKVLGDCDEMWPQRDTAGLNGTQRESTRVNASQRVARSKPFTKDTKDI